MPFQVCNCIEGTGVDARQVISEHSGPTFPPFFITTMNMLLTRAANLREHYLNAAKGFPIQIIRPK